LIMTNPFVCLQGKRDCREVWATLALLTPWSAPV
jgi:hypothetical protein